ncbi:hypothetical protein Enr13x_49470 [Stieleria neptunia]|uniref:Uncharacterized protein n=1 Tax=Stieleria neptunia TaxID=2527979 RepID=A0A518HWC4_9BACT|nr:hypothetical protein [Stieleria neptunia]QDV45074.1 hypothetical protein Enr13x_49470 [Stieleria neptunia]
MIFFLRWLSFLWLVSALSVQQTIAQNPPNTLSATEILERACAKYSECKIYTDTGTIVTRFKGNDVQDHARFSTRFRRPNRFHFEFESDFEYELVQDGDKVQSKNSIDDADRKEKNFSSALSSAHAITDGSVSLIAGLLMPDEADRTIRF